jgi:hypothetical protein
VSLATIDRDPAPAYQAVREDMRRLIITDIRDLADRYPAATLRTAAGRLASLVMDWWLPADLPEMPHQVCEAWEASCRDGGRTEATFSDPGTGETCSVVITRLNSEPPDKTMIRARGQALRLLALRYSRDFDELLRRELSELGAAFRSARRVLAGSSLPVRSFLSRARLRTAEQVRYSLAPGRYAVPVPAHIDSGGA